MRNLTPKRGDAVETVMTGLLALAILAQAAGVVAMAVLIFR